MFRLSGTFPFNEDEEIEDVKMFEKSFLLITLVSFQQIRNANFMFPTDPWKDISHEGRLHNICLIFRDTNDQLFLSIALSFLQTLLELDSRKRLQINRVFLQPWLQVEH